LAFNYPEETAKELWVRLFGALDELGVSPEEILNLKHFNKSYYEYEVGMTNRQMTFGSFSNAVSKYRTKK
jgi:hypothetical protein